MSVAKKGAHLQIEDWNVVFTGLAYLAGQHSRQGDLKSANKARDAYNKLARQIGDRVELPVYSEGKLLS